MSAAMHGVAVDAGSGLAAALAAARGPDARPDDLFRFKQAVLTALGPDASTVLLDADAGPRLLDRYPPGCAPMIAYEADVYRIADDDRITVLPAHLRVADYPAMGVRQLKFFLYYAPDDPEALNARKRDMVAGIGAECAAHGIDFLFEPLVYDRAAPPGSPRFAAIKPDLVARTVATFADPRFGVTLLKIEVPVDLAHVEGFGAPARTRAEVLAAFRAVEAAAAGVPFVFLSAGVPFAWFEASLGLARAAGIAFRGFMCGRAIWSDAVAVFGAGGPAAAEAWLGDEGRRRLARLKIAAG